MTDLDLDPSRITLVYRDSRGSTDHGQPLPDITESGTLIDPDTGDDMELVGAVLRDAPSEPLPTPDPSLLADLDMVLDAAEQWSAELAEWIIPAEKNTETGKGYQEQAGGLVEAVRALRSWLEQHRHSSPGA